ncbi:hypothetical protein D5086_018776 [Populus alba]|uniref:Uncharacterized protein n=1 Tax=Populus alba TaxID=43335 RepID=A0ACC4BSA5_POPAL
MCRTRLGSMPSESDKWGWEPVSVFGGFDRGSGTKRWKCNHCNLRYNGSYSRVRAHLLGFSGVGVKSCLSIDRSLREAFQVLEEERVAQKKKKSSVIGKPGKLIRTSKPTLAWETITKEDVDDIVARFFYADGLNIDIINSSYFREMVKAIASFGSGPRGLVFLKAVDVDDTDEGEHVFTSALIDTIMEVGPTNVLQIVLHLGDACKSSESYVLSKFPNIFWSPCTSHSVFMLMEGIAEVEWVKPIVLRAKAIEECMITYQHNSSYSFGQNLKELSDPISAKFAPSYCFLLRVFGLRQSLQDMVVSEDWKQWKHNITEDVVNVESAILDDGFWRKAHSLLQLYEPFVRLLATIDIGKSVIGAAYDWRFQALEALRSQAIDDGILNQLEGLVENRWDVLFSPLHAAAGRLGVQKMEDLFFIRNNLRLHGRINGNLCFSFAQRNAFSSSSSGVETWEGCVCIHWTLLCTDQESCTVGSIPKQSLVGESRKEEEEKKMPSGPSIKEAYFLPYLLDGEPLGPALSQDLCPLMYERRISGMEQQEEMKLGNNPQ